MSQEQHVNNNSFIFTSIAHRIINYLGDHFNVTAGESDAEEFSKAACWSLDQAVKGLVVLIISSDPKMKLCFMKEDDGKLKFILFGPREHRDDLNECMTYVKTSVDSLPDEERERIRELRVTFEVRTPTPDSNIDPAVENLKRRHGNGSNN